MNKQLLRRFSVIFYWALFLVLALHFFTNDFGIVDIHKSTLITAVAVDTTENEVQLTAQLAVPKPSQSGDNIEYTEVQGSGETIADALNEINAKTGFYPQLEFCNLVLLGESCKEKNIFQLLGCLYRKNYSELTASVAICNGNAAEMLAMPTETSDMTSSVISRALANELKASANVSAVNLKDIAADNFSESQACYMPIVEASQQGTSEEGGNGDNVGGDKPQSGSSGSSSGGGGEGESGGGGGGGGSAGGGATGSTAGGANGGQKPVEFTARKTAIFRNGMYAGTLDDQQSFALDILKNEIRLAVLPCDTEKFHYTLGLGNAGGGISLKIENGEPKLKLSFSAGAQIAGVKKPVDPPETANDDNLTPDIIQSAEKVLKERLLSVVQVSKDTDCDFLGIKTLLYKFHSKDYASLKDSLLSRLQVETEVKIVSAN